MNIKKIIFPVAFGIFSFSAHSMIAKSPAATINILPIINICQGTENHMTCEARENKKIRREIVYLHGKLSFADVYYKSGRLAKKLYFDENEKIG